MSENVDLREVRDSDLELFYEQEHDPEAARRAHWVPREREAFMRHWRTRVVGEPTVLVRTVTVDTEPAGNVVSWWDEDRRFVGYWFGRQFWGRGIGSTAMMLFLRQEKNRPLHADPFAGNTGSVRLLEKCGFRHTGTVRYGEDEHLMLVLPGPA